MNSPGHLNISENVHRHESIFDKKMMQSRLLANGYYVKSILVPFDLFIF